MSRSTRFVFGTLMALSVLPGTAARAQQAAGFDFLELFSMLDGNNDQVVERSEVPEKGREAFDRLLKAADSNANGKVERDEYRAVLVKARDSAGSGGLARPMAPGQFEAMDKNKDGKVARDEFEGPAPLFQRVDADADGFVTQEEVQKFRSGVLSGAVGGGTGTPGAMGARLKAMDKNSDGKISREEFEGPAPLFDRMDKNQDGQVDVEELRSLRPGGLPALKKARRPGAGLPKSDTEPASSEPDKPKTPAGS